MSMASPRGPRQKEQTVENSEHEAVLEYMYEAGWREYAPGQYVQLGQGMVPSETWAEAVDQTIHAYA